MRGQAIRLRGGPFDGDRGRWGTPPAVPDMLYAGHCDATLCRTVHWLAPDDAPKGWEPYVYNETLDFEHHGETVRIYEHLDVGLGQLLEEAAVAHA